MRIEVVDSIEKLLLYKADWESILEEMNSDIAFLELDWVMYWWKFFGEKYKLLVLIITEGQEIIGICPLMSKSKGFHNEIYFIGNRESSSNDFIVRNKYKKEAVGCVCEFLRKMKGRNIIRFEALSTRSANYETVKKYFEEGRIPFVTSSIIRYFLNIKHNDYIAYYEQRFGKKTRQTMSSKEKKLKSLGKLTYGRINSEDIEKVFEIHEKRWLRKIGNSSFSKGDTKEFFKKLASDNDSVFKVSVDAITLNSRIISFMYGFPYKERYYFVRIAHDDDFYFLSPGELVFRKKMEECFSTGLSIFDFGLGYEPYKAKWSDDFEEVQNLIFPSQNIQSSLAFYMNCWVRTKLRNALKKNKIIYNFRKYSLGKLKFLLSMEHLTETAARIRKKVKQVGMVHYFLKFFYVLIGKVSRYKEYQVFVRDLNGMELSRNNLQIKEASIDELDELSEVMNESTSNVIRRFINKHKCFIVIQEGNIIYYCWISCSSIELSGTKLNIPFRSTDANIYDSYLMQEYNGENTYMQILLMVCKLLYEKGFRRCYITLNSCSRSHESEIFNKIFHLRYKIHEKSKNSPIKYNIIDLNPL